MSKCTEDFINAAQAELRLKNELSPLTKKNLILDRLITGIEEGGVNAEMLGQLLTAYEPRLKLFRNGNELVAQDAFNQKVMEEVRKALEAVREEGDEFITDEERTVNFHTKGKLSISKLVHQFIGTIPLLTTIPIKGTTGHKNVNVKRPFLSSRTTLPILIEQYAKTPNLVLESSEDLEALLVANMDKMGLPTNQRLVLHSIYQFLFSPEAITYRDMYGNEQMVNSVLMNTLSPDLEVASRNRNYLTSLTNTLASINGESILTITNEDGRFDADNNVYAEQKAKFNANVATNLYTISNGYSQDGKPVPATIHLRPEIVLNIKGMQAEVTRVRDSGNDTIINKRNPDNKDNIYQLSIKTKRGIVLRFTFALNGGEITTGRPVEANFNSPLAIITHLNDGIDEAVFHSTDLLQEIFNATGIDRNIVSDRVIADYITDPYNQQNKGSEKTPWEQLWQVAVNNVLALTMANEVREQHNAYKLGGEDIYNQVRDAIDRRFSGVDNELSPRNLKITLANTFGRVAIGEGVNTFFSSPLMNFSENTKLIRQLVSTNNISPTSMQRNVNNDNVNKYTTASNIEFIKKTHNQLINNARQNKNSVFNEDIFVGKNRQGTVTPRAFVEKIVRLDGFKDRANNRKSLSNQNVSEINHSIHKEYAETLKRNWDPKKLESTVVRLFNSVLSDKTAFVGMDVRLSFNALPNKNGKLDLSFTSPLIREYLLNDKAHKDSIRREFVEAWRRESLPTVDAEGNLVLSNVPLSSDTFLGTEQEVLEKLLLAIPTLTVPNSPMHLLVHKHYAGSPDNKYEIIPGEPFRIKPLLIQEMRDSLDENYSLKAYQKLLAMSALNNNLTLVQGLSYDNRHNDFVKRIGFDIPKDKDGISAWTLPISLDYFFQLENGVPLRDANGEYRIKEFNTVDAEGILASIHPLQQSHFLVWNIISPSINRLLFGDIYQYKGDTNNEMLGDRLKRSAGAIAPYKKLSIDKKLTTYGNTYLPATSDTVLIKDIGSGNRPILGNGQQQGVNVFDGGSFTNPITEIMMQESYGAEHGEMPKAGMKPIYSHTNLETANNLLYKYALHTITSGILENGDEMAHILMKIFMGSKPLGRPVNINVVTNREEGVSFTQSFAPTDSLLTIHDALLEHNKVNGRQNIYRQLVDIMSTNQNPLTGMYDLKTKIVSQIVFESSNKTGQSNLHEWEDIVAKYAASVAQGENGNRTHFTMDLGPKAFKEIDNTKLGIQLDATYEPENTTVALYSQGISNGLLEGRMQIVAQEMLESLSELTKKNSDVIRTLFTTDFVAADIKEFKDLRLAGLPLSGHTTWPTGVDEQQEIFDTLEPEVKRRLYIRSILLASLEAQDITNTTYQQVLNNTFSQNDPQVEQKLTAALNSHFTKQTISLSIPGGNYILSPTSGLITVFDAVDGTGKKVVVTRDRTIANGYGPIYGVTKQMDSWLTDVNKRKGRDLAWKGYTKSNNSIFDTDQYQKLAAAYSLAKKAPSETNKQAYLVAKANLQKEIATGYTTQPAEIIMAFPYKEKFGITEGMQPVDVTEEFFYLRALLVQQKVDEQMRDNPTIESNDAETNRLVDKLLEDIGVPALWNKISQLEEEIVNGNTTLVSSERRVELLEKFKQNAVTRKAAFDKALNVLVGRIPSTGPQSAVMAKVVGFIDSSSNAVFIPSELMIIQGADLDIDKAVILNRNFTSGGEYEQYTLKDNKIDYENSTFEQIQNYHTEKLFELYDSPINALATNVPVTMETLQQQKRGKELNKTNHPMLPSTVSAQKVLTSEGKAMVGVFANGLKAYALTYFAYTNWNKRNPNKQKTVAPLRITIPTSTGPLTLDYQKIANQNPQLSEDQAWEMYSGLVNAATDNAKELILGAIGANLQSGNIINLLTLYGVPTRQLFAWLEQDVNQAVLKEIAHSIDIDNKNKGVRSIVLNIDTAITSVLKKYPEFKGQTSGLKDVGKRAKEFSVLAKVLGINRQLPNTPYKKYNFTRSLENYINEKAAERKIPSRFNLAEFVNDASVQNTWIDLYETLKDAVNIPFVLQQNPHILGYLKTKVLTDEIINTEVRSQGIVSQLLDIITSKAGVSAFKNVNEDEYNAVSRYVNELQVYQYLKSKFSGTDSLKVFDTVELSFDLANLEHANRFVAYFPAFFAQLKTRNFALANNPFFNRLESVSNVKGDYLAIPNIEDLTKGEIDDLQYHLNNSHLTTLELGDGKTMSYGEFKRLLFTYSLIVGKGKVSRSSFFELFESGIREEMGYNRFMDTNKVEVHPEQVVNNVNLLTALVRFAPRGGEHVVEAETNQLIYTPRRADSPPLIQMYYMGILKLYVKQVFDGAYHLVNELYKVTGISANNTGQIAHIASDQPSVQVNKASDVRAALVPGPDGNRKAIHLVVNFKGPGDQDLTVPSNVGFFKHNRAAGTGIPNSWLQRRPLSGLDVKVGGQLLDNLLSKLTSKYPTVTYTVLSAEEIADQFGEQFRTSPAFTNGQLVVINRDEVTMDAPMHEFGHVHLAILRETNPELYARAIELALQDDSELANLIRDKYSDKDSAEVGEEIFVTLLGFYGTKQLMLAYPGKQSWLQQIIGTILDFFAAVREHLGFIGDVTLDKLDLSTASLGDLVSAISHDMLNGSLGNNLSKLDKDYLRERKSFVANSQIDDVLNTLVINEKRITSKESVAFKDSINSLKAFLAKPKPGEEEETGYPFPANQLYMYEVAKLIKGQDWYGRYNNVYTLSEFARTTEITGMDGGGKPVRKPPLSLPTENKNILVKTRIINGQVTCELYDMNNFNTGVLYGKPKDYITGQLASKEEAKKAGITFDSSQFSVNNLRMGLLAIEANVASKDLLFNVLTSITLKDNRSIDVDSTYVEEAIANWQGLAKLTKVGLPVELTKKIRGINITGDGIRANMLAQYRSLIPHYMAMDKGRKSGKKDRLQHEELVKLFDLSDNSPEDYQNLLDKLNARHNFIVENRSLNIKSVKEELDVLSRLTLQVSNIRDLYRRNDDTTVGEIQSYTGSIGGTGVGVVEFIAKKILGALGQLRKKLMLEFKPAHDKKVVSLMNNYRDTNGIMSRVEDFTLNDARKFFNNLMETKVIKDKNGEHSQIFTGQLVKEDSEEYRNLSVAEKEYLDFFNDEVQKAYKAMYPDRKLERGTIPILKWRNQTGTIGTLREVYNSDKPWATAKKELNNWLDGQFNDLDYEYVPGTTKLDTDKETVYSLTEDKFRGFMEASTARNEALGLDKDGALLDKEKNGGFERDLSTVLQLFTANGYRKQEFDKVSPYLNSVKYFIGMEKISFKAGKDFKGKMIEDYWDRLVYNKVSDSESFTTFNKILNKLSAQSSTIMLGLNWTAALGNFVTGFSTNYRQAILNSVDTLFDKQANLFNAGHLAQAEVLIAKDWELAGEMNKLYGFNSLDYQQMVAHNARMSKTSMKAFGSDKLFWINFIGDYYNRNTLFMAQMLKDGSYGAYSMTDTGFTYDEKKDQRFHTNGIFDSNKPLYKTIKANLSQQNGVNTDGTLKYGYDENIRHSMKYAADKIHGSYDNDFATNLNNYALGKLLLTFRKYYQNKLQQYVGGLRAGRINEVEGRYVTKVINGVEVSQWQGAWQEGIFVSLINIAKNLRSRENIRPEQLKNAILVAQDIAMVGLISLLFSAWFDDDDEKHINPLIKSARNSLFVTYGSIDPRLYTKILAEPSVVFSYYNKEVDNLISNIILGKNGKRIESLNEFATSTIPLYKSEEQTRHIIDYIQQGPVLEENP